MAYKTLTTIVTDREADSPALAAAREMAERRSAHLDVHCLGIDPARYEPLPVGSAAVIMETGAAEARSRAEDLEAWVRETLPSNMASVAIGSSVVPNLGLDAAAARLARYSDLVIAGKPYGQGRHPTQVAVLESVLFGTGAPLLVVPPSEMPLRKFDRIAVAWNESDEAMAAVRKALPLLVAADRVDILLVDPPSHSPERSDPGGAICVMLARHGVRAEVSILSRTLPRVSDVILRFLSEHGSDLLVMGAYGHSRFREAILGGATRDILESADLPVLMAH